MKKIIQPFSLLGLLMLSALLSSCNNEDDVMDIFVGKTWKLTYISTENSNQMYDFWGDNEQARKNSTNALAREGTFILNFEGSELNNTTGGTFNATGISATISGRWNANGETRDLSTSNVTRNRSENDALANAFYTGLVKAFRYEGDENNLYIYYTDNDNSVKRLNLKAQ